MAHSGKTMTFATDLVPQEDNIYSLGAGNPQKRWKIFGEVQPLSTKTYDAPLYNSSSGANYYQTFATVIPVDYNAIWIAHYRITITADGHSDYTEICDVSISGRSNTYYSYKIYNSIVTYSIYQHMLLNSNSASNNLHELGYRMASSYGATDVSKVVKVELLEQINCTVTLLDNLKLYTSATPSGYTWRGFNATSNGLQETGDINDTGLYIYSNGFKGKAGSNKVYRYCLFARTGDGTYESFVMQDNTRATTKTANPHGFVPDGKIYWNSGNSTYSEGTLNISAYEQYHVIDYLYSFNFNNTFLPDYCETYVVYTYNEDDGLLYLDTTQWLAAALPTTADGKIYQRIGSKYYTGTSNYYQGSLLLNNPYYEYRDGEIRFWSATHLSSITGADDLKAIEALSGTSGLLKKTAANTWTLDTSNYVTSSGITSVTIGATSPVQSSTSTAQSDSSASTTISLKDAYGDTKNPYGSKTKNYVLAAPSNANGAPSFRTLVAADIPNLSWNKITSDKPAYTTRWPTWDEVTSKPVLPTGNARIFYGTCSDAAAAKTVTCDAYDSLQDGDILFVNFSAVNTGAVGSITLNVNGTGARNVKYLNNGSDPANIPGAGYIRAATYMFRYKQGTSSTNSYWIIDIQYDSNSNTYDRTYVNNNKKARVAITAGSICVGDSTGYAGIDNGVTFDITYPILYSPNSISAGSYRADLYIYIPSITSTVNTTGLTHVANGILYMTGTLSGNTFTCNSKTLTYTQPTSEDGIIYIPVAINTNATSQSLYFFGGTAKMFWYKNGAFRPYVNDAATVNGHTVATDVPSNAVFTDTTYTFDGTYNASSNKAATVSTVTNAINALDGTITGSGSTTKTITALSQTNGKVSATFSDIAFPVTSVAGLSGAITASNLTETLGLSKALRFVGVTTTDMTGGTATNHTYTGKPAGISDYTPAVGDVVINSTKQDEWVCTAVSGTTYTWERLGSDTSYKIVQSAVADPTAASTTSTTFIDTISQNANGVISATKKTLPTASTNVAGIIKIGTASTDAMAGDTTVTNVSYIATTDNYEYPILMKNSTGSTTTAAGARFASGTNQQVTINPSTGTISTRRLVINNSASNGTVPDLVFSRTSWSYINIPDNDAAVLAIGRSTGDNASQKLIIQGDGVVRPGSDNTQVLGKSTRRWKEVHGVNFYGTFNGTATYSQGLAKWAISNSDLNNFVSNGALRYSWEGGNNNFNSKPTDVNAFGVIAMKTATNWTGQLLMSTDSEPGLYWRTNLTAETPSYGSWTPLASGNGGVYYGTCATAADVVEKVVVCKHYHTLKAGDIIVVTFTNSNTQAQPTLNVNNTGAVSVKMAYSGGIVDLGSTSQLRFTCTFIYDGTYWLIINQQNAIQLATSDGNLNWRSVLLSDSNSINENFTPTANTLGRTYAAHNVKYQPSTGTLRAPIMKTPKVQIEYDHVNKAHIEWNDTDSSIDFIFD